MIKTIRYSIKYSHPIWVTQLALKTVNQISKVLRIVFQINLHSIAVNEDIDEDEGYDSIASKNNSEAFNSGMK